MVVRCGSGAPLTSRGDERGKKSPVADPAQRNIGVGAGEGGPMARTWRYLGPRPAGVEELVGV